jgi:hypothetical protein
MPHSLLALATGAIKERRASILVRETVILSPEHRAQVDSELAGKLGKLGDAGVEREARKIAYRLDPGSAVRRARKAASDRRISIRPAPDTMAYVTGLLPVAAGVAVYAALTRHADSLKSSGDPRTRGQIMADTFVERITGQSTADAVPVEVQLVMTDRALFAGDDVPAQLSGHGAVPAAWARRLVAGPSPRRDRGRGVEGSEGAVGAQGVRDADGDPFGDADRARARIWLRRLYADPTAAELVAMESTRRTFDGGLRRFLVARDGAVCRTPWCDAPIRHLDHVEDHASGGPTSATNGQGLCVRCNHTKQLPGWRSAAEASSRGRPGPHRVVTTTPTGHGYVSEAPPLLPGHPPGGRSLLEEALQAMLDAA